MTMKFYIVCEMYRLRTVNILFNEKHYTGLDLLTECKAALITVFLICIAQGNPVLCDIRFYLCHQSLAEIHT